MSTATLEKVGRGIYRDPETGRYVVRLYSPRQIERTLDEEVTTLEQARTMRRQMMADLRAVLEAHEADAAASQRLTLHYATRWVENRVKPLRASTRKSYLDALRLHILPHIGHLDARSVTREDVQALVRTWERERKEDGGLYSTATLRSWYRVLRVMLRDMAADLRIEDPTRRVSPPKRRAGGKPQEKRTLTGRELGAVVAAAKVHAAPRYAEIATLAFTGLRTCELYALQWGDLDLSRGLIHVSRSYARGEVNSTKTGDPRDVVVPAFVVEVLRAHRRQMMADQHVGLASGLVFPSALGTHRTGDSLRNVFRDLRNHLGIDVRVTPQVLRRTFNTLMLDAGVDRIVLRSQIGHCDERMTERYAGVGYEMKAAAAGRLERLVLGGEP